MRSGRGKATTDCMIDVVRSVVWLLAAVFRRRAELVAENALLRQQLIAAQRKIRGRVRWTPWQRFTMGLATKGSPSSSQFLAHRRCSVASKPFPRSVSQSEQLYCDGKEDSQRDAKSFVALQLSLLDLTTGLQGFEEFFDTPSRRHR